jgi:hypothetical protein
MQNDWLAVGLVPPFGYSGVCRGVSRYCRAHGVSVCFRTFPLSLACNRIGRLERCFLGIKAQGFSV